MKKDEKRKKEIKEEPKDMQITVKTKQKTEYLKADAVEVENE